MEIEVKHLKLLIVDDEGEIRDLLNEFFTSLENQCDLAVNGREGFMKVVESYYDFIIMDIRMPQMNGIDCIKAIRQVDPLVPILIITAFSSEEDVKAGLEAGANGIIRKPFSFPDFIQVMEEILRDTKARD